MNTTEVYENIILTSCFSRLKSIRNRWREDKADKYGLATIIDIGGEDYRSYDFIMDRCEAVVLEMIPYLIMELLKAYGIKASWYQIKRTDAHVYSVNDTENWPDYVVQGNKQPVFVFSCDDATHKGILYIFKEYGIGNHLPKSLIDTIIEENELNYYCYISIVEQEAYKEILNHNNNENDPSRGTGIFSLKQFFESFFGMEEYELFKKYADDLTNKVKDYYGFEIVRTLKPNTLHNYRRIVRDNLLSFDIEQIDLGGRLSQNQRSIIETKFFDEKNYEIMTGTGDFAQSYMTAEWLFTSLTKVGNIDLTAIAMGYFKAIEQLLFAYIKLHTNEKDGATRRIHVGKAGLLHITDALMEDEQKTKDMNLGSLTGFFGFYNIDKKQYWERNKDLLVTGIDNNTYEYIIDVLSGIVGLRNGFFHKHNLLDWEKVVESRNSARLVFYLLLGSYKLSDSDKKALGRIEGNHRDSYYKLCEYMNKRAYETGLEIPIFYMNGQTDPYDFWCLHEDDFIEYDIFGEPIYSGIYFGRISEKNRFQKTTQENLPSEIWEGVLRKSRSAPIEIKPSGPIKKIYADREFCEYEKLG